MIVLTLNSGSSSLKFGLYQVGAGAFDTLMTGELDDGKMHIRNPGGSSPPDAPVHADSPEQAVQAITAVLVEARLPAPEAIGHRIVHGGPMLRVHCLIDDAVERDLEAASPLSPLHAPRALAFIRLARSAWPDVPQIACFDTAFHADMPDIASVLPLSKDLREAGVRRYGFHGLSCESIVRQFGPELPARLIIAHLGSGASVTAARDGRSLDTSMGLTPSGGVLMATRSGDLDPGVLIYLLREKGFDADMLENLVDRRSGLFGISDLSGDLRELHKLESSHPDARLAIEMFCISVAKQISGMIVTLAGVDAIVFTGGIGEHDSTVRADICARLGCFDIVLDEEANRLGYDRIDQAGSRAELRIFASREDEQIAHHVGALTAHMPALRQLPTIIP